MTANDEARARLAGWPGPAPRVVRTDLVAPRAGAGPATPFTVRPRAVPVHGRHPRGTGGWLRNAAITVHGDVLEVTDARGRRRTWPRGGPGRPGVTALGVCRESVATWLTRRATWGLPEHRDRLVLLTHDGRRLADLDLYGWTATDLADLARAGGLGLSRHQVPGIHRQEAGGGRAAPPTPLEAALPVAPGWVRVAGRRRWPKALDVVGAAIVTVLGLAVVMGLAVGAGAVALRWSERAAQITLAAVGVTALTALVFGGRRAVRRLHARRHARLVCHDEP